MKWLETAAAVAAGWMNTATNTVTRVSSNTINMFQNMLVPDSVVVLNDDNFEEHIQNAGKGLLVKFYAPWCGHCKNMASDYNAAAAELKEEGIVLADLDATVNSKTSSMYGVKGFPTLKWFYENGLVMEYNGGRTKDKILEWVRG